MNKKLIIFDKDATLIDFDKTWLKSYISLRKHFEITYGLCDKLFDHVMGYVNNQFAHNSIFKTKSSEQQAEMLQKYLDVESTAIKDEIEKCYDKYLSTSPGFFEIGNVDITLKYLSKNYDLALVTSDSFNGTINYLKSKKYMYFKYVYTSECGLLPKPNSSIIKDIKRHKQYESIIMVGDSDVDYQFYKNNDLDSFYQVSCNNKKISDDVTLISSVELLLDYIF